MIYKLIIILLCSYYAAFADNYETIGDIDTNKIHMLSTVNVVSERLMTEPKFQYSSHTIFDKGDIANAIELSEIISTAPGVFIKNYGGLGGLKTVSIRGTSSAQTLITLNGMPINSMQNGGFDLSELPLGIIDKIEVVRGGQSAIAGSNAIGGIVNLSTNIDKIQKISASATYTSFDEKQLSANYNFNISNLHFSTFAGATQSPGDYPFEFEQFGESKTIRRKNASFSDYFFSVANQFNGNSIDFKSNLIAKTSKRGVPGAVLQGRIEAERATLKEDKIIATASIDKTTGSNSTLKFDALYKLARIDFSDVDLPAINSYSTNNKFNSDDIILLSSYRIFNENGSLSATVGVAYSILRGDMLDPNVNGKVDRLNPNIAISYENIFPIQSDLLSFTSSVRADFFNDNSPAISPMLGVNYRISGADMLCRSQISYNFRMPNFNEMYYLNYGTSDLKPERSTNLSLGLSKSMFGLLNFDISTFYIETKEQIVSVPKSPISWSAENIDKTRQYGVELSLIAELKQININKLGFNWTLMNAINRTKNGLYYNKHLPFVPLEIMNGMIEIDLCYAICSLDCEYSSFRYIYPSNDKTFLLPEYFLLNAGISVPVKFANVESRVRFDVKNIFNESYWVINNYPMPGRQFLLGISVSTR